MLYYFQIGGPFMWILLVILIAIIVLAIINGMQLFGKSSKNKSQLQNSTNSILFWGIFSAVVGFFAHQLGLFYAFEAIKKVGDISPSLIAGGYSISLITLLFGIIIFMLAAIIWFVFKNRLARL